MKTIEIEPSVLKYYIENSGVSIREIEDKVKSISKILSGEKVPSFNQLSDISKKINVPTGFLILNKIMETRKPKIDFRTLNSNFISEMSNNLKEVIKDMELKQDFLREETENELAFIGSIDKEVSSIEAAKQIRAILDVPGFWQIESKNNAFNYFRAKINKIGVYVFISGIVKQNTHKSLDLSEFRGFSLYDKKAPIIFINAKDSTNNGKLFTIIHELVHLFLNNEGITNYKVDFGDYSFSSIEVFANKITSEILVPINLFSNEKTKNIDKLSKKFKVSKSVINRRLFDFGKITREEFESNIKIFNKEFEEYKKNKEQTSGGNYYNTLKSKIDPIFFNVVRNAIYSNKISYTEAFNLIGVSYKGYKELEGRDID